MKDENRRRLQRLRGTLFLLIMIACTNSTQSEQGTLGATVSPELIIEDAATETLSEPTSTGCVCVCI